MLLPHHANVDLVSQHDIYARSVILQLSSICFLKVIHLDKKEANVAVKTDVLDKKSWTLRGICALSCRNMIVGSLWKYEKTTCYTVHGTYLWLLKIPSMNTRIWQEFYPLSNTIANYNTGCRASMTMHKTRGQQSFLMISRGPRLWSTIMIL